MLKKFFVYIPSVAVPILVNAILTFLYAKYLAPDQYGMLNIVLNTVNIVYSFSLSFIQSASFRFYSDMSAYKTKEEYITTFLLSNIIITLILMFLAVIVQPFISMQHTGIVVFSVGINALYQFYLNLYRLEGKNTGYIVSRISAALLILFFFVFLITYKENRINYLQIVFCTYLSYGIIALWAFCRHIYSIKLSTFSINLLKKAFIYGMPMMGVTLLGNIISSSDQYILKYYLGDFYVGLYSLGHKLSDMTISNITLLILLVATPVVMREYDQNSNKEAIRHLSNILLSNIWVVSIIVVELICYSSEIISFIFKEYRGAENIIRLVAISAYLHSVSLIACKPFELKKQTSNLFIMLVITAIINVAYNVIFIPIYGLNAAAHSSIIAYACYILMLYFFTQKSIRINVKIKEILRVFAPVSLSFVFAYAIKIVFPITTLLIFIFEAVLTVVVYMLMSLVFGNFKIVKEL